MKDRLLKVEEVALAVGVSAKTINSWYLFKKENPRNEYAKLLPSFSQAHPRAPRYWKQDDVWRLIEFKQKLPQGRNGVMGSVTQRYVKTTKEETNNGKKKVNRSRGNKRSVDKHSG